MIDGTNKAADFSCYAMRGRPAGAVKVTRLGRGITHEGDNRGGRPMV